MDEVHIEEAKAHREYGLNFRFHWRSAWKSAGIYHNPWVIGQSNLLIPHALLSHTCFSSESFDSMSSLLYAGLSGAVPRKLGRFRQSSYYFEKEAFRENTL